MGDLNELFDKIHKIMNIFLAWAISSNGARQIIDLQVSNLNKAPAVGFL